MDRISEYLKKIDPVYILIAVAGFFLVLFLSKDEENAGDPTQGVTKSAADPRTLIAWEWWLENVANQKPAANDIEPPDYPTNPDGSITLGLGMDPIGYYDPDNPGVMCLDWGFGIGSCNDGIDPVSVDPGANNAPWTPGLPKPPKPGPNNGPIAVHSPFGVGGVGDGLQLYEYNQTEDDLLSAIFAPRFYYHAARDYERSRAIG